METTVEIRSMFKLMTHFITVQLLTTHRFKPLTDRATRNAVATEKSGIVGKKMFISTLSIWKLNTESLEQGTAGSLLSQSRSDSLPLSL